MDHGDGRRKGAYSIQLADGRTRGTTVDKLQVVREASATWSLREASDAPSAPIQPDPSVVAAAPPSPSLQPPPQQVYSGHHPVVSDPSSLGGPPSPEATHRMLIESSRQLIDRRPNAASCWTAPPAATAPIYEQRPAVKVNSEARGARDNGNILSWS